jgi:hypothetical protein
MTKDRITSPEGPKDRLAATVAIIAGLGRAPCRSVRDPRQTTLGLGAFHDGLWPNRLLCPEGFGRLACRERPPDHLAALFPEHFPGLRTGASRASDAPGQART